MGTPGIAVERIGEDNSESTVRFLIEWVSDGEAEARSYLAVTQNLMAQALSPRTVMMSSLRRVVWESSYAGFRMFLSGSSDSVRAPLSGITRSGPILSWSMT
jgi:hypothetical protein